MNYKLLFALLALSNCVLMSLKDRCACNQYPELYCNIFPYCSWDKTAKTCGPVVCSQKESSDTCDGKNSEFKCKWNTASSVCEDFNYTCGDLSSSNCDSKEYGMNCLWQNEKCEDYVCSNSNEQSCDYFSCSFSNSTGCSDPYTLSDCSTFTDQATCDQIDGNGNICYYNDQNLCKQFSLLSQCSDYSNVPTLCDIFCNYNETSKTCSPKQCDLFNTSDSCLMQLDLSNFGVIPCIWKEESCQNATTTDIEGFDVFSCIATTLFHYTWSATDNKCVQCNETVTSPLFDYMSFGSSYDTLPMLTFGLIALMQ